jgi:RNA polymerase sigma-70 factor (ECF subfamily)
VDTSLVIRAQEGDEGAFRDLTHVVGPRLFNVAFSVLRERTLAEDATQQALLRIWRKLPRLRDPARFEAWSYRILVHACYAEAKRSPSWEQDTEAPGVAVAADAFAAVAHRDQLERGFRRLSVDHRAVIVLHHLLDLTLEQTAEALGIPVGTVRSRLYHAMQGMRAALDADRRPAKRPAAAVPEVTR